MKDICKWGIIAPGSIACKFAAAIKLVPGCELHAAASRSLPRAEEFIKEFGGSRAYGDYHEMITDPEVDAVYIASPHMAHAEQAIACLNAGKPVLCEKALAVNTGQVQMMIDAARTNDVFLMEAMWTRFFPTLHEAKRLIDDGAIGKVRMFSANFGFCGSADPAHRILNPDLAGGALLDVGIYPLAVAHFFLGAPSSVTGSAYIGATGVDEHNGAVLKYDDGTLAVTASAVRAWMNNECRISGTEGSIVFPAPFHHASEVVLHKTGGEPESVMKVATDNGFEFQITEVVRCLRDGKKESDIMPLGASLSIMETMDSLRKQWGLKYPFE